MLKITPTNLPGAVVFAFDSSFPSDKTSGRRRLSNSSVLQAASWSRASLARSLCVPPAAVPAT